MFLRVLAATGAVVVLSAVACSSEAVTTAEVAGLSTSSASVPAASAPDSSPSAPITVAATTATSSPAGPAAVDSPPATTAASSPADSTAVDSPPATTAAVTSEAQVVDAGSVIDLKVIGTELEGGARRESIPLGEKVTVRVSGTSTDHVHIHGYDLFIELADGAGELIFSADIPGVFEIELEGSGTLLVQMEVK